MNVRTMAKRRARIVFAVILALCVADVAPLVSSVDGAAAALPITATTTITPLPIDTFGGILVDDEHSRIYVSGGDSVLALDLDGDLLDTVAIPSAAQMALDASTSTLYVAHSHGSMITKIDTDTGDVLGTISLSNPLGYFLWQTGQLVFVGQRLWIGAGSTNCNDSTNALPGALASTDPSEGSGYIVHDGAGFPSLCIEMATSPALPDTLFVWEPGRMTPQLFVYDVSTGSPAPAGMATFDSLSNLQDVVVYPSGDTIATAAWSPANASELATATLEPTGGTYPLSDRPNALAVTSADGGYLASSTDSADGPNLFVYPFGSDSPKTAISLGGAIPARRGLAFSPDGAKLAVVGKTDGSSHALFVLDQPTSLYSSTLDVAVDPSPALVTDPLSISFDLSMLGPDSRASQDIEVARHNPDGSETPLTGGKTDLAGHLTITDEPGAGTFIYAATWAGDEDHRGAVASASVLVNKLTTSIALNASKGTVTYAKNITLTAHISGYQGADNPPISIFAKPYGGVKTLAASGTVNDSGSFSFPYQMRKKTVFTAEWAGDLEHSGADSGPIVVLVRARVDTSLSRFYSTSGVYRLYHYTSACPGSGSGCPRYRVQVLPNHRGRSVYVTLQTYRSGSWGTRLTSTFRLNKQSERVIVFIYANRSFIGVRTRVRAVFKPDEDHLRGTSPWSYFRVTE